MPFHSFTHEFRALGTDIWVQVVLSDRTSRASVREASGLRSKLEAVYARFEKIFSRFDPDSDLSHCNGKLGEWCPVPDELADVARRSIEWHRRSHGYFDPRILEHLESAGYAKSFFTIDFSKLRRRPLPLPPAGRFEDSVAIQPGSIRLMAPMDFAGIAKGYITDRVADFLRAKGLRDFLLDSGGDMRAEGHDETGNDWLIDLEHARQDVSLRLSDRSVATSGITRRQWHVGGMRFHHLINPREPDRFSFDLLSVTVVGPDTETADIQAKTLFLMGQDEGLACADRHGTQAIFLSKDGVPVLSRAAQEAFLSA